MNSKTKTSRTSPAAVLPRPRSDTRLAAKLLRSLRDGQDLRLRKARRLRAAIRVDRYENDLKLQVAADRLLGDLNLLANVSANQSPIPAADVR